MIQNAILRVRWLKKTKKSNVNHSCEHGGLNMCHVVYINLYTRPDRKEHIEKQFKQLKIDEYDRFDAIADKNGALGCAKSHYEVLKRWEQKERNKQETKNLIMVCEDDCDFKVDRAELDEMVNSFCQDERLDVLCLGNNRHNGIDISGKFAITSDTQTTSCYLVKDTILSDLLKNINESISELQNNRPERRSAVDMKWKTLQKIYFFAVPTKTVVTQLASYSDVRKKIVDYDV